MPGKNVCNKIKDPAARKRCLAYKGEFAPSKDGIVKQKSKAGSAKIKSGRY